MGESVVGYAQHLLMLTTKLNAAQADAVNPAMLCDRFIDGLHPPSLRRDIRRYAREHAGVTFHQARAEAQRWMREDADVEVRAEQVLVAQPQHSKEVEELRAQVAALTAELQAELQHQSTRAPRPTVCYWCEQPGRFQLEPPSNPAVPSHGSTLRGTALDHAFHPTRETRGPRCQDPDNGGHESCGHDWTMPHSRHCDER